MRGWSDSSYRMNLWPPNSERAFGKRWIFQQDLEFSGSLDAFSINDFKDLLWISEPGAWLALALSGLFNVWWTLGDGEKLPCPISIMGKFSKQAFSPRRRKRDRISFSQRSAKCLSVMGKYFQPFLPRNSQKTEFRHRLKTSSEQSNASKRDEIIGRNCVNCYPINALCWQSHPFSKRANKEGTTHPWTLEPR